MKINPHISPTFSKVLSKSEMFLRFPKVKKYASLKKKKKEKRHLPKLKAVLLSTSQPSQVCCSLVLLHLCLSEQKPMLDALRARESILRKPPMSAAGQTAVPPHPHLPSGVLPPLLFSDANTQPLRFHPSGPRSAGYATLRPR